MRAWHVQVDRSGATEQRCGEVESNIFDLFAQMGATEEQLDFQVLYASAREVFLYLLPAVAATLYACHGCLYMQLSRFCGELALDVIAAYTCNQFIYLGEQQSWLLQ